MSALGAYILEEKLGRGGMGETWKARHKLLGLPACLKMAVGKEMQAALLREAELLWDLHHPALPALRDVWQDRKRGPILAMRYVEGQSLDHGGPLSQATALQVLGRVLKGLRVLHHRGIVHNDVKPANIILEKDRHGAVLVDFGVSSLRPRSRDHAPGYTPAYVAPELLAGAPPTPESDLYSLGLTILEKLGGNLERRVLPEGVDERLLRLLTGMCRQDPARRLSWRANPIGMVARLL